MAFDSLRLSFRLTGSWIRFYFSPKWPPTMTFGPQGESFVLFTHSIFISNIDMIRLILKEENLPKLKIVVVVVCVEFHFNIS